VQKTKDYKKHELLWKPGWTRVIREGEQFLLRQC
jgi:hypothetical protein